MIFEDGPFKLGEKHVAPPANPMPGVFARGDFWSVIQAGNTYRLSFLSGDHAGREKQIEIDRAEAEALAAGTTSVEAVLIAHSAG